MDLKQHYTLDSVRETIDWLQAIDRDTLNRLDVLTRTKAALVSTCAILEPLTTRPCYETTLYNNLQAQLRHLDRERDLLRENHTNTGDRLRDLYGVEADLEAEATTA